MSLYESHLAEEKFKTEQKREQMENEERKRD